MKKSRLSPAQELELMAAILSPQFAEDPYAFIKFIFPWGQKGTPLEHIKDLRSWQKDELERMRQHIIENKNRIALGMEPTVYQSATVSGRGPGKSALLAMIAIWLMSTRFGMTVIFAANSEDQLTSRTLAELGKWHTLALNSHWFEKSALSLRPADWFKDQLQKKLQIDTAYYYAQGQLWSEERPDSFAGVHNHYGICVFFDEASGIPEPIWTVTKGFFTEPTENRFWLCFSNGRRNTGAFFECFHKNRDFWRIRHLDSRTVEGTDKSVYEEIIRQYGEDSDEARVEVYGQFPRQGDNQFISRQVVDDAVNRELIDDDWAPLMMGVDPARFGDDLTVIRFRQGRNGRVIAPVRLKGKDNMEVAAICAQLINKYNPDAVCIDAGNGTGVIDRLRQLKYRVHEVWFGGASSRKELANKRTEMWTLMKEWLAGACIDNFQPLIDDLTAPMYKYSAGGDRIMLESKDELKRRGHHSPDDADALALTFAVQPAAKNLQVVRKRVNKPFDYKVFS